MHSRLLSSLADSFVYFAGKQHPRKQDLVGRNLRLYA